MKKFREWASLKESHYNILDGNEIFQLVKRWSSQVREVAIKDNLDNVIEDLDYIRSIKFSNTMYDVMIYNIIQNLPNEHSELINKGYEILNYLRVLRRKGGLDKFFVSYEGGNLGNISYRKEDEKYGTRIDDFRVKKKILELLDWLEDAIIGDPNSKGVIDALHNNVYDYDSWQIGMDIADDLGKDTTKIRSFLKSIFIDNPPTSSREHKVWSKDVDNWT